MMIYLHAYIVFKYINLDKYLEYACTFTIFIIF